MTACTRSSPMADIRDTLRNPDCELCPLHHSAQHVCLLGSGPIPAEVMIVGEAPGEREDDEHRAFVGRSGKLLDKALTELADLDRDSVYVTNAVKCRPPENATPDRKQMKTCSQEYMPQEVEAVQPKFILTLGNTAMLALTGKSGITKHHGSVWRRQLWGRDVTIMATVHPAAVLRNPTWAQAFGSDMTRFGQLVRGVNSNPETRVLLVNTVDGLRQLIAKLKQVPVICFDIETYTVPADEPYVRSNLQEWHGDDSKIVSISFSWCEGLSAVVPINHPQSRWKDPTAILRALKPVLERRDCEYIAHNGKFDCRWLHEKGIRVPLTIDTMLAAHMIDENRSKGLENLARTELGVYNWKGRVDLSDATKVPLNELGVYNGKDTDYPLRLWQGLKPKLEADVRMMRVFSELMMPASRALVDIERTGVYLDPDRWQERHDEAIEKRDQLYEFINRGASKVGLDTPINLNSPQQVGRFLFEGLNLPVIQRTKKGAPSTAESILLRLASQSRYTTAMIKYRKWAKYLSTYLLPWWFEHRDSRGRIHSSYKLYGTVTGRLSGEGGIQQVPRDPFIRSVIGAEPGWMFVLADYSQIELRIAAMVANEKRMLRQYIQGEDIHMSRACKMTGKLPEDVTKEERKKAKAVNFGYIYGMGAAKFVTYAFDNYGMTITQEEAEEDRNGFFEDYPALRPWHQRQRRLAQRYQRVISPIGRVRHLKNVLSSDKDVRAEAERQAINSPVQSMASDMMLFSLVRLHATVPPSQARIVGTVHDSILFEVREDKVSKFAPIIRSFMEDTFVLEQTFGCEITVPIIADVEVGLHWGEGEPWQ